jgi:hypothetical protein
MLGSFVPLSILLAQAMIGLARNDSQVSLRHGSRATKSLNNVIELSQAVGRNGLS